MRTLKKPQLNEIITYVDIHLDCDSMHAEGKAIKTVQGVVGERGWWNGGQPDCYETNGMGYLRL